MIRDYQPGTITPEEEREGDSFKVNHRGDDKWLIPLAGFVNKFCRWVASKKRFRVIIDYDPEWSMIVNIRPSTYDESVMLDAARPDEAIMKNLKRCEEQRRQEDKP